jgi:hypothetical protein
VGTYSLAEATAEGMLKGSDYNATLGASHQTRVYNGTPPTNADTALSGNTLLATLTGAATAIASTAQNGSNARATFGTISSATAAATGTASFFRRLKSDGVTVVDQGSVGTSAADMIVNTTAFTSGSTISITSGTTDLPKGP